MGYMPCLEYPCFPFDSLSFFSFAHCDSLAPLALFFDLAFTIANPWRWWWCLLFYFWWWNNVIPGFVIMKVQWHAGMQKIIPANRKKWVQAAFSAFVTHEESTLSLPNFEGRLICILQGLLSYNITPCRQSFKCQHNVPKWCIVSPNGFLPVHLWEALVLF